MRAVDVVISDEGRGVILPRFVEVIHSTAMYAIAEKCVEAQEVHRDSGVAWKTAKGNARVFYARDGG